MKIIKSIKVSTLLVISLAIMGFTKPQSNIIKIGTIAGPETGLVELAKDIAKKNII